MHVLANENVPRFTVAGLRAVGHDIVWARTDMAGSGDDAILARAEAEGRIVLTHDKDFGNLAYHAGLPATCGIILVRLGKLAADAVVTRTVQAIQSQPDWAGHFCVIDERRVRMRPLPAANSSGVQRPFLQGFFKVFWGKVVIFGL